MPEEHRLETIEKKVDVLTNEVREIVKTLQAVAVQDTEIRQIRGEIAALFRKLDALTANHGPIHSVELHQASCPRKTMATQLKALWVLNSTIALYILAATVKQLAG